jgi:hypothetical protein
VFDDIRAGGLKDRSQFFEDLSIPFLGVVYHVAKLMASSSTA